MKGEGDTTRGVGGTHTHRDRENAKGEREQCNR